MHIKNRKMSFLVLSLIFSAAHSYPVDVHQDCGLWAERDKECVNNPNFMWGKCLASCLKYAKDDDDKCAGWAAEGECTANQNYIHAHCPESCKFAIAWNPWVRQEIKVDSEESPYIVDECSQPIDVFAAADIMRLRLANFIENANPNVIGLNSRAPSEFLGIYGLTEAVLYALNLYDSVISAVGSHDQKIIHKARIEELKSVLAAGI